MSSSAVDRIVAATLYEGYILYPYRPSSVKNQVRWTFGGVHPRAFSEATGGSEPWQIQTECLLRGEARASVHVRVRFLQLVTRTQSHWDEATERDVDCGRRTVAELRAEPASVDVAIAAGPDHEALAATVALSAEAVTAQLTRVRVVISNLSEFTPTGDRDRERAMRHSLVSTHAILTAQGGAWLSLADPPDDAREAAAACRNTGLWPVLVGEAGSDDTVLASPIILEDHPQVAAESAGDLFDATEIDEILSLRILTLTDAEKAEMRAADPRARALLERTEQLGAGDLMRMHGTIRALGVQPTRSVRWEHGRLQVGDRVRLAPRGRADIWDIALSGRVGVVESIERDYEDAVHVAVVVEDDPGRDLGALRQPGHRFFFSLADLQPLTAEDAP